MLPVCLLFVLQTPNSQAPKPAVPDSGQTALAEQWLRATPIHRIKSRNLFHPTRGVTKDGDGAGSSALLNSALPVLVGTQVGQGHQGALLKFPGIEDADFLAVGATQDSWRLESVQRDKAVILHIPTGRRLDLDLDAQGRREAEATSDLEQLIKPAQPRKGTGTL